MYFFFFSSRRRHTRCALVTGVQTCALPIWDGEGRSRSAPFLPHSSKRHPAWCGRASIPPVCFPESRIPNPGFQQPNGWSSPPHETGAFRRATRARMDGRSEEHTSELQSLMRISYAVFCLKKKKITFKTKHHPT